MKIPSFRRSDRIRTAVSIHDLVAAGLAMALGVYVRAGDINVDSHLVAIGWFAILAASIAWLTGLNRGIWRYASIADLEAIVLAATATIAAFTVSLFVLNRLDEVPRGTILFSWAFLIAFLSGPRIAYRIFRNWRSKNGKHSKPGRNVLLIGANENAERFIKAVFERSDLPYDVVGVIDDRNKRVGQTIRGIRVLGNLDALETTIERLSRSDLDVDAIILATGSVCAGTTTFDMISKVAIAYRIELMRLPDISDTMLSGKQAANGFEPKRIELRDLLPRQSVSLDRTPVEDVVRGSSLLVTGAGGSIGSELCRQLLSMRPKQLVLVDFSEFLLYSIQDELQRSGVGGTKVIARLANVRDREQIHTLFAEMQPEIVFHAAALKHVPMVEAQPLEGLATNVLGTRNVADAALAVNARAMVLVSTDKAINPTNVMGASKRMAEAYCQGLSVGHSNQFVTVRFGNVLGSAGSVVPLFEKQIAAGGPLTVTHPEIERFFMTIPEAVELILHATAYNISKAAAEAGRIFVLDMGKPVKIVDVARKMIRLAGREPDKDIRIEFVGLRPGEKLYEELFDTREEIVATSIAGLLVGSAHQALSLKAIADAINELEKCIEANQLHAAIAILKRVVPEYTADSQMAKRLAVTNPQAAQPVLRVVGADS